MRRKAVLQLEALEDRFLLTGLTDFQVNSPPLAVMNQLNPAVAVDGQGNFVVVWQGINSGNGNFDIFAQRYHSDGTPLGGEMLVNAITAGAQQFPKVATDTAGDFVVVWSGPNPSNGKTDLYGRRFDATGQALTGDVLLDPSSENLDSGARVAMNAAGTEVVVTRTEKISTQQQDVYAQLYDGTLNARTPNGNPSTAFSVDTPRLGFLQNTSRVAMDAAGNFTVTWS